MGAARHDDSAMWTPDDADDALKLPSSFRDRSGFVFTRAGTLFRQVNPVYRLNYDAMMSSGLYAALTERGWLIPHTEVDECPPHAYRVLAPERVPYISYPQEWCFGQLKAAALLTLDIQATALSFDLTLKDASAFNVQFIGSRPVFIDTLSFERYVAGRPWVAYKQFCEHFLAPLALMAFRDIRLRRLVGTFIDGLPLDLVSRLLPRRSLVRYGLLAHLHLHGRSQRQHAASGSDDRNTRVPVIPKHRMVALVSSLRAAVQSTSLPVRRTEWSHYYEETNYSSEAMKAKEALVGSLVDEAMGSGHGVLHDLGANTGRFSRLVHRAGRYVVAHDIDEMAVERSYQHGVAQAESGLLPLVLDLTMPTPASGWGLVERSSALERIAGSPVLALALIHHLAIGNNVPLDQLAKFFARLTDRLVIEFVPKDDSQVRRLLATRDDVFPEYNAEGFERTLGRLFVIERREPVPDTVRTLYLLRRRGGTATS